MGVSEKKPALDIIVRNKISQGRRKGVFPMLRNKVHGEKISKTMNISSIDSESNKISIKNLSNNHGSNGEVEHHFQLSTTKLNGDHNPGVPDIQMINRYYGLVPKKFIITARNNVSDNNR